jgi:hypothetical protein
MGAAVQHPVASFATGKPAPPSRTETQRVRWCLAIFVALMSSGAMAQDDVSTDALQGDIPPGLSSG